MHQRSPQFERRGITLIEVLLVLAVLVMLAAMTWPALDRPMADQRLRKAADRVRTSWAKARIEAMSTGRTFVFRCNFDSDEYTIESQAGPESIDLITSSNQGEFDQTSESSTEPLTTRTRKLLKDIRFVDGEVDFDTRATILSDSVDETGPDSAGQDLDPILFYPDGTTSTAKLVLESRYKRRIDLSLRGLTGVITVSDTYLAEDSTYDLQD